jgi:hypothetical protein
MQRAEFDAWRDGGELVLKPLWMMAWKVLNKMTLMIALMMLMSAFSYGRMGPQTESIDCRVFCLEKLLL